MVYKSSVSAVLSAGRECGSLEKKICRRCRAYV